MRNTTKKATVRLSDIAKETGYSLSTVSKALNGRADVSEETRQTINAVLKRYGYSRKATGAKSQRIIEIVFQDFDNVWALEVLRGAIREAKLHDLNVITTEGGNRQHPDSSWIDNMLRRQDGWRHSCLLQSDTYRTEQAAFQRYSLRLVRSIR